MNYVTLWCDIDTLVAYICAQPRVHKETNLSLCRGLSVQNTPHRHKLTFPYTINESVFWVCWKVINTEVREKKRSVVRESQRWTNF